MAYYVLNRPEGTDAFDQGAGSQIADAVSKMLGQVVSQRAKQKKLEAIQKAAGGKGLDQEFSVDEEGNVTAKYKTPEKKSFKENIAEKLGYEDMDADQLKEAAESDPTFQGLAGVRKDAAVNRTASIESAINDARSGKKSWKDVINLYPLDADKIRDAQYAEFNEATRQTIEDIGGQPEAYKAFLGAEKELRSAGVNVDAVKEVYSNLDSGAQKKKFDWSKILQGPAAMGSALSQKIMG